MSAEIGQRIRHWRRLKGLTIEQLSEAAELDPKYLGAVETGRRANPSYLVLRKIACGLGVDIAILLSVPGQNEK
ncbi:MAG: helix-turn-helix transcriptional regulator [Nitrospirae bacterium]|nr:helix-turn-helix transcriptional regulator [Nitrospirota bacterium]